MDEDKKLEWRGHKTLFSSPKQFHSNWFWWSFCFPDDNIFFAFIIQEWVAIHFSVIYIIPLPLTFTQLRHAELFAKAHEVKRAIYICAISQLDGSLDGSAKP